MHIQLRTQLWLMLQAFGISHALAQQVSAQTYQLDIAAQSLAGALNAFAQQSGFQIVYFTTVAQGLQANSLSGRFTASDAICRLTQNSGVTFERVDDNTIAVRVADGRTDTECRQLIQSAGHAAAMHETADTARADDRQSVLEEIVVTAQKRTEMLQKVPLSIASLTGREVAGSGIGQISDMQAAIPGLQILPSRNAANIFIRGIGSDHTGESSSLGVSYSVDGISMARAAASADLYYDLQRIEVIRGPQSTLYGTSAIAGGVNVITHQPTFTRELSGELEAGNYDSRKVTGVVNVPLTDTVALRVAAQQATHDGFTDNFPARNANDQNDAAGRIGIRLDLAPQLLLTTTVDYFRSAGMGRRGVTMDESPLIDPAPTTLKTTGGQRNYGVTMRADWSQDIGTLTYLGSARRHVHDTWTLGDNTPDEHLNHDNTQQSHEFRFFNDSSSLRWLVGAYWLAESTQLDDLAGSLFVTGTQYSSSLAVFGQATWSLNSTTRVTTGLRYTRDRKGERTTNNLGSLGVVDNHADVQWRYPNFRVGIDFDVGPDSLLYANLANGFKAGGYNASSYNEHPTFGPEKLIGVEVGSKNRFMQQRLQLNLTAFDYRYSNFHATYELACECATDTINAQRAVSRGIELESVWLPSDKDRFDLSINYLNAAYRRFVYPGGDYSGYPLAHAPRWTGNLIYRHVFALAKWRVIPRLALHHESAQSMTYDRRYEQQASVRTDVSLTLAPPDDRWSAQLNVTNLTDEVVVQNFVIDKAYLAPPRQISIRLQLRL